MYTCTLFTNLWNKGEEVSLYTNYNMKPARIFTEGL